MLDNVSIIIPIAPDETAHHNLVNRLKETGADVIISSEGSRTESMNVGAAKAERTFLWFLHADSQVSEGNIQALQVALQHNPSALHYFNLAYTKGFLTALNAAGANLRSIFLGLPYGDQGFCLSQEQFAKVGGYPEAPYGEDVLFVRLAKRNGIALHRVSSTLVTSARKYAEIGWFKLTMLRQFQIIKLLAQKL